MIPNINTSTSSAIRVNASVHQPGWYTGATAFSDKLLSIINIGAIKGKPNMAISAGLWFALDAIADKKVNRVERLRLPVIHIIMNKPLCTNGQPSIRLNRDRLTRLISSISTVL